MTLTNRNRSTGAPVLPPPATPAGQAAVLEGLLAEDWCHLLRDDEATTFCGEPPSGRVPVHTIVSLYANQCPRCGRRRCPDCRRLCLEGGSDA